MREVSGEAIMMKSEAEQLALVLDDIEADLCRSQQRVYRVRQALEKVVGKQVGYQYTDDAIRERPKKEPKP
jgi:hypothetical protein